jgi:hypothetical protein
MKNVSTTDKKYKQSNDKLRIQLKFICNFVDSCTRSQLYTMCLNYIITPPPRPISAPNFRKKGLQEGRRVESP